MHSFFVAFSEREEGRRYWVQVAGWARDILFRLGFLFWLDSAGLFGLCDYEGHVICSTGSDAVNGMFSCFFAFAFEIFPAWRHFSVVAAISSMVLV